MLTLQPEHDQMLLRGSTTIAMCAKITRTDGFEIALTDFNQRLTTEGTLYTPYSSYNTTRVDNPDGVSVGSLMISSSFSIVVTKKDLLSGIYDASHVDLFLVDYTRPELGRILTLSNGWLGEIEGEDLQWRAEFRDLKQALNQKKSTKVTPNCRHELGDSKCGKNLTAFTQIGTVLGTPTVPSDPTPNSFYADIPAGSGEGAGNNVDEWYTLGNCSFLSGNNYVNNNPLSRQILQQTMDSGYHYFRLIFSMPYDISIGDSIEVVAGCRFTYVDCDDKYNNSQFFGGFLFVPGNKFFTTTPSR